VEVGGVRFTVIGVMARKIQLSNYFSSDDDSAWIPYSTAGRSVEHALRGSHAV
jgi:putative ABC transport system permease protein